MFPYHVRRLVMARLLVLTLAMTGLFGFVAAPAQAQARSVTWQNLTLPGGGDAFDNYDYHSRSRTESNVDWPVNLIFVNNATVPKVKEPVAGDFPRSGSIQHGWVAGDWDDDRGRKQFEGDCKAKGDNYHFRVYAPSNTDRMYNMTYGYFGIGTSHNDYSEGCGDEWFGDSEVAEGKVAEAFRSHGYSVSEDNLWLDNYEAYAREGTGIWNNDGMATVINIP